ncbi:MAG: transposase [Patescibacteria group bacterium]
MKMSLSTRKELIKKAKARYLKSDKKEKTGILDELCKNTELNRNYLYQLLSPKKDLDYANPINRKRREVYGPEVIVKLKRIWELFDYPCGQNLAPMMEEYIAVLEKWKEMSCSLEIKNKLISISSATIDRRLKRSKDCLKKKIFSTTKPGSMLKKQIPIKTSSWDEKRPGFGELDTVAHCGDSASGEFINSLTYTDILTQWTESVAVMGKAQIRIRSGLEDIEKRLPFPLLGIDPDNGGEFINWQLYRHCIEKNIEFTRGRPYKKNDNAHIEQKNWTHVRKLIGYSRLDKDFQLVLLNSLYLNEWRLYKNFFIPNKKLISKKE